MTNPTNPSDSIKDEVDAIFDVMHKPECKTLASDIKDPCDCLHTAKQKLLKLLNDARIEELEDLKRYDWTHEPNEHPDDVVCGHIDKRIAELRKDKPND